MNENSNSAETPEPAEIVAEQPGSDEIVAEQLKPAEIVAEQPEPAEIVAEQPKPAEIVAEQPKPAEIVAEQPEPAETVAEQPEPVVVPESPEANEGRRKAQAAWDQLVAAHASGQTLTATVKSAVKGGLLLDLDGYRGFLPASHVRAGKGTPLESLVNTPLDVKVIDVDQQRKRVVVSHRRAMEEQRRSARTDLLRSLQIGEEREATVVRLTDFGAFVDLGGIDALIPLGELAFERVEKAADVVTPGERLNVKVLRIDENGKKIAVSRKAALADPWRDHAAVLRQGSVVEGKVVAKEPRLTVEIAPGVTGTLGDREANPEDYEIGESVEVTVRSVDYKNRRIRLGTPHAQTSFTSSSFAPLGTELKR